MVQIIPTAEAQAKFVWQDGSPARLRDAGVEWLITHDYPLPYSEASQGWQLASDGAARLEYAVDPGAGLAPIAAYDRFDAFYLPFAGLGAVSRPGPHIRIYRLISAAGP